jgi:hypothetical protein
MPNPLAVILKISIGKIKMIQQTFILALIILPFIQSCNNTKKQNELIRPNQQIDTSTALKIRNFWVSPKKSFEFNSLISSSNDTLSLVTCSEYVYSPFGQINNRNEINNGLLRNFSVTNKIETMNNNTFEFLILKHGASRLILFLDNDPESSKHSYIFQGDINDSDVNFIYGIKIGMSKELFITNFFDSFTNDLLVNYNIITFESCVQDIIHTYTFKADKLQSVNFKSNSHWKVNY